VLLVDDGETSSERMLCDVLMCWTHAEYDKARLMGLNLIHTQCSERVGARAYMSCSWDMRAWREQFNEAPKITVQPLVRATIGLLQALECSFG
jgi:hypothetical protein